jgi:hypothetical protein
VGREGASSGRDDLAETVRLAEELERNYVAQLQTFMLLSRRALDTAGLMNAVLASVPPNGNRDVDIRRMAAVRARLREALASVRTDFQSQTEQMVQNPMFSDELKLRISDLRTQTASLQAAVGGRRRRRVK